MRTRLALASCWLLPSSLSGAAQAKTPPTRPVDICLRSCQLSIVGVRFRDWPVSTTAAQLCLSRLTITSIYLCLEVYCDQAARGAELATLNETCVAAGGTGTPPLSIIANYTAGEIERLHRLEVGDDKSRPDDAGFAEPVLPSAALHQAWFETLDAYQYVKRHHALYASATMLFWIAVVAIGAINRAALGVLHALKTRGLYEGSRPSKTGMWLKRKMMLPATFGYRSATEVWCGTIPPRTQTLTLVAFAALNVVFSVGGYRLTPVNLYFPSKTAQLLRYVSDRTGIISFANFPVIWLFGMRNNVALWLTGWDFGTYTNFHRWVARMATLHAIVHSAGYTVLVFREGGWKRLWSWWQYMFWVAGQFATVAMCALVACSIYWLRRQRYELFLILHIAMSLLLLVSMLGHVSIFNGRYDAFFWIPALLWTLDRVLRLVRILCFNPTFRPTLALASYSQSANMVRLQVPCRSRLYQTPPGMYYYLTVLEGARFWESHPFTMASVSDSRGGKDVAEEEEEEEEVHVPLLETGSRQQQQQQGAMTPAAAARHLTFLIRPYDGFTRRIRDRAAAAASSSSPLRLLVDGPYGHSRPLHLFEHILFVTGGSGIVVPLAYLGGRAGSLLKTVQVQIHWAVREPDLAAQVLDVDLPRDHDHDALSVDVYLSARHGPRPDLPSHVCCHHGRPDVRAIIVAAARSVGRHAALAVVACGPARLADDARQSVVHVLDRRLCRVEYFQESFRW